MYTIGVDLGGTKIHGILVHSGKRVIERIHLEHEKKTRESVLEALYRVVGALHRISHKRRVPVGLGVPSVLDPTKEVLLNPPNVPSLKGLRLAAWLRKRLRVRVKMENDARCFVLGAVRQLGFKRRRNGKPFTAVGVTVGTGLGGGVWRGGNLWDGAHGIAGSIGHTVAYPNGERCACGRRGCLEMYASRKFLMRVSGKEPKELERLATAGNRRARSAYEQLGHNLGIGIASIVRTMDPDVFVLGGGISKAHKLFLPSAKRAVMAAVPSSAQNVPIVPSVLRITRNERRLPI